MSKTSQINKAKEAKKTEEVQVESTEQKALDTESSTPEAAAVTEETVGSTVIKVAKTRGKKYLTAKKKVDPKLTYKLDEAIKLVQSTSLSKFVGKVEAHVTTVDMGNLGEITFPHLEASAKNIVILNDTILAELKDGKVNFDILIATPVTMPKLLPFARLLGPKGLMPNPKNGTLTDKPEEAVKKLSVAKAVVRTEKKAPVVHLVVGKISQPVDELLANVNELIKVIKPNKIKKLVLCATMGPSVKVEIIK